MKQFLLFLKTTFFSFMFLMVGNLSMQTNFVARDITFVSADKTPLFGSMSTILDGDGKTGLSASGLGSITNIVEWNQSKNLVIFFIDMNPLFAISNWLISKS
jgi:hypothetical protein